ncbi:MAG: ATP-dependent metallopeptidase FtsH/Yme1/Tma family protein [Candidatus Omnitrophica bacterium]|nr:ATP-dependent metallopeptidase FtsH/Yme1/Tma family protein [Candidatus Omnitrophota bacterium]
MTDFKDKGKYLKKRIPSKKKPQPPDGKSFLIWFLVILGVFYLVRIAPSSFEAPVIELSYSKFYDLLEDNKEEGSILSATLTDNIIRGNLSDGRKFFVNVLVDDQDLIRLLRSNVDLFEIKPPKTLLMNIVVSFGPLLLFVVFLWFMYRGAAQGGGKIWSFGKSRAQQVLKGRMKITFKDVAGVDEAKEELMEVIEFLQDPKKFQVLGGKIPKGVLLLGPPGCGKTLLAKAVAGEAGVPFFSISGSDFVEMFVGVGASRVRDLFEQAKKSAKLSQKGCIIFIDEIDAVGRQRFAGIGGGHDEREQTLNALLVEMDGFNTQEGVILIAATNRPDVLDPALLRPGRFDRQIVVDMPDIVGREEILKVHIRNIKIDKDTDLKAMARRTPMFTGADIANLVNEAALLAARRNKKTVEMDDFEEAAERVMAGPERKSRVINKQEKRITAYHEAGHALLALLIPDADPPHKVSILPRGLALGYTFTPPDEDRHIHTENKLLAEIIVALGGRISEEIIFNELSTGAQNDLRKVSNIARHMVTRFGMSQKLGHLTFGRPHENIFLGRDLGESKDYSDETARIIDTEVKRIVDNCYKNARTTLEDNKKNLTAIAEKLLEKEVLSNKEVKSIVGIKNDGDAAKADDADSKRA